MALRIVERGRLFDVLERCLLLAATERGHAQGLMSLQRETGIVELPRQDRQLAG